jgi:hypothetical protein
MSDENEKPKMVGGWPMGLVGGEMRAMLREENLCGGCLNAPICKVNSQVDDEMMLVVSRCLNFLDASLLEG